MMVDFGNVDEVSKDFYNLLSIFNIFIDSVHTTCRYNSFFLPTASILTNRQIQTFLKGV
jgi:hypothetical protein